VVDCSQTRRGMRGAAYKSAVVGVIGAALVVSACGSSSKSAGGSTPTSPAVSSARSTAQTASGSPINVMTIYTATGTAAILDPEMGETAQVYAKWINANGGINGHPLKVTVCDDQGTQTQAATCAREAVSDNDVAVVGSFTTSAEAVVPILRQANIAWFGPVSASEPAEFTSPNSFPAYNVQAAVAGMVGVAYQSGCKKVSAGIVSVAIPRLKSVYELAAKQYGQSLVQAVSVPITAGDYSAEVSQVLSGGADCVVTSLAAAQYASWMPAWAQSGTKAVLYGAGGQLSPVSTKGYESAANGSVNVTTIPDISAPSLNSYRTALQSYKAPTSYNYDSLTGVGTWAAYVLFTNVAKPIQGAITSQSFLSAASQASSVSSNGILPVIDFAKPWTNGPAGEARSFDCGITYQNIKNGQFVQTTSTWQNAAPLLAGSGKLGPAQPSSSSQLSCES
jgi:branched-chain amino acid transport system substrate-binding protein